MKTSEISFFTSFYGSDVMHIARQTVNGKTFQGMSSTKEGAIEDLNRAIKADSK